MVFSRLTSTAFKCYLELVTKPLSVKVTSNMPWDRHTFICLLLWRISIEMPDHANKKKRKYAAYHISFISKENTSWLIKNKNYINHKSIYNWFVFFTIQINCRLLLTSGSSSTGIWLQSTAMISLGRECFRGSCQCSADHTGTFYHSICQS